jgi:hypothetical protein
MIQWLHKYVFRGIGIAILIGMLTILYLKISWVIQHGAQPVPAASQQRISGAKR